MVRRQARAGQGEALVQLAVETLGNPATWHRAMGAIRIFQGIATPDVVLLISEWDSRPAFDDRVVARSDQFDALCERPFEARFFERLVLFEDMGRRPAYADCSLVDAPPDGTAAVLHQLQYVSGPAVRALPELTMRCIYQDLDAPGRLLVLRGWSTNISLEGAYRHLAPRLDQQLVALGAHTEHFYARARGDLDRYAEPVRPLAE